MIKIRLKILLGCLFGSILLVVLLDLVSGWTIQHPGGFIRKLPSHQLLGTGFIKLNSNEFYFAGGHDSILYLGNRFKRSKVLSINLNSKDTFSVKINGFDTVGFSRGGYLRTDSSNLYLFDGNKPAIFKGNAASGKLYKRFKTPFFTAALPYLHNSFVLKVVEKGNNNALIKLNQDKLGSPFYLEQQGDGIFSTDGMLLKGAGTSKLLYVYYYRNQFISLDSSLNIVYRGKTIDTVTHANIKVAFKSQHELTMASPPAFVNKHSAVNERYLFIHSALKADNEINSAMVHISVIDVYQLSDGKYVFSFYIGDFSKEKMKDFRVYGHTLVALFDSYLYTYQLKF